MCKGVTRPVVGILNREPKNWCRWKILCLSSNQSIHVLIFFKFRSLQHNAYIKVERVRKKRPNHERKGRARRNGMTEIIKCVLSPSSSTLSLFLR